MPFNVGPVELILVLAVALLILGPGKLPEVGSAFGKTIREFRRASTEIDDATRITPTPARPDPATATTATPVRDAEDVDDTGRGTSVAGTAHVSRVADEPRA